MYARERWLLAVLCWAMTALAETSLPGALQDPALLEARLPAETGESRLQTLEFLADYYRQAEPARGLSFSEEGLQLATQLHAGEKQAQFHCHRAWAYNVLGRDSEALTEANLGLRIAQEGKYEHGEARCLNVQGFIAQASSEMAAALDYFQQLLKIEESLHDAAHTAMAYNNLGITNTILGRYDAAIDLFDRGSEIANTLKNDTLITMLLVNKGEAWMKKGEYEHAQPLLTEALDIRLKSQNIYNIAYTRHQLGVLYTHLQKFDEAAEQFAMALAMREKIGDKLGIIATYLEMAVLDRQQKHFDKAELNLMAAEKLAGETHNNSQLRDIYAEYANLAVDNKDYVSALKWDREAGEINRKMFSDHSAQRLAQLEMRLADSEKKKQIELLTRENELQRMRGMHQLWVIYVAVASIFVIVMIAFLLVARSRNKRHLAEAAVEARSRYLAQMSHEIRTPMTGIIGVTDLLVESHLSNDQKELVNTIRYSGEALLTLINDILDLSKLDAGKLNLSSQPFDLRILLESALELFALNAERKGIQLSAWLPLRSPVLIFGDEMRLRQIIVNLVGNALKFTESGYVTVLAEIVETGAGSASLSVDVRDSGVGMSEAQIDSLFEPFSQHDVRRNASVQGTGLGLVISQQLAHLMDGEIRVHSEVNKGSEFHLSCQLQLLETHGDHPLPVAPVRRLVLIDLPEVQRLWLTRVAQDWSLDCLEHDPETTLLSLDDAVFLYVDAAHIDDTLQRAKRFRIRGAKVILLCSPSLRNTLREQEPSSVVVMTLPLRFSALPAALEWVDRIHPPVSSTTKTATTVSEGKPRALVVDDNDVNRKVAAKLMEKLGLDVITLEGGYAALAILDEQKFDVVLMDCQMPDLDGYETTKAIRQKEAQTNSPRQLIIAVTANALKGDREKCLAAGMDDYVAKPVKLDLLGELLERWTIIAKQEQR